MKSSEIKVFEYDLPIKIEENPEGGFSVSSPAWSDCYAQGDTVDEAVNEITAVAATLIELYKEEDLEIPLSEKASQNSTFNIPVLVSQ